MWLHCETNDLFYINVDNFDILKRLISLVNLNILDGMDDFKPSNRPAKDGVLAVQPGRRGSGDKPLGTVTVWLARIRHGYRVWAGRSEALVCSDERTRGAMGEGRREDVPIVLQICVKFIFEIISPNRLAARAISQRVTRLDHLPQHQRHMTRAKENDAQISE